MRRAVVKIRYSKEKKKQMPDVENYCQQSNCLLAHSCDDVSSIKSNLMRRIERTSTGHKTQKTLEFSKNNRILKKKQRNKYCM